MPDCLVATDMDGTLLNHHDYRYDAVLPCLQALQRQAIPVILNTSKTWAELQQWRERLHLPHPFIVENGSAIFIPDAYFSDEILAGSSMQVTERQGFRLLVCGKPIDELRRYLAKKSPRADDLSACSLQQAIDMTGLTAADAARAQSRDFSIPLRFHDPAEEQGFSEQARADGYGVLKGGRFLHLIGESDKGSSQQLLKRLYETDAGRSLQLIALGDSPNDVQMLESADIAVLVKSPSSERFNFTHPKLVKTRSEAPEGWVEGIERALSMVEDSVQTGAD